jgi:hypothetical protein
MSESFQEIFRWVATICMGGVGIAFLWLFHEFTKESNWKKKPKNKKAS